MSNPREFVFVLSGDASGIEGAARRGQSAVQGIADSTTGLEAAQKRATSSADSLSASLFNVGVVGISIKQIGSYALDAARGLTEAQIRADRLMLQLTGASGAANAGRELAYVRQVSNTLGLELNSTSQSYARLAAASRGTSMEGQATRQVFDAVTRAAAVMGLNVEESQGVLRALEQMMSKGVVQAEELRGQLGDRMPGALQIAARALNVTTSELSKMVERGEVISSVFLPAFAKQLELELGGGAEKAADSMQAATNRAGNAWDLFLQTVAQSGAGDFIKGQLNIFADAFNNVSEAMGRAKDRGSGFAGQMTAAGGAVLQFLNPLNAIAYNANSAAGELQQAKEKVAALKAELITNPGNIFLRPAIEETEELIRALERAQRAAFNFRRADNETLARMEALNTEDKARRTDALRKVTEELAGANTKLAQTFRVLAASYTAGDIDQPEYTRLVHGALRQFGPKGSGAARKPDPEVDHFILDGHDARERQYQRFVEADKGARDFMLDQVQRSDERVMIALERRQQQAAQMVDQIQASTGSIQAGLLQDPQARGQALIAVERAQLTSRLALLKLNAEDRKAAEDAIASYVVARQAQLTEELKPEWQRLAEAWDDTQLAMKRSSDDFLNGWLATGRDVFMEFGMTGKINVSSLVNYMRQQFLALTYSQFLAKPMASFGQSLLGAVIPGMSSGLGSLFSAFTSFKLPSFITGGASTGTNLVQRDMITLLHKGEAVVPEKYNPAAGGSSNTASVVIHQHFNLPPGSQANELMAAAQAGKEAAVAAVADLIRRGNPAFVVG